MPKRHRLRTGRTFQAISQTLEKLEGRMLMATAREIFSTGNIDTSTPTSTVITDTKEGPMSNVGGLLTNLYLDYRKFRKAGGLDANYHAPDAFGFLTVGSKVAVTVRGLVPIAQLTEKLRSFGAGIIYRTGVFNVIDAMIPITMLHTAAVDPTIATINPVSRVQTAQAGTSNNQADEAQLADLVRSTYGLTGTGVKIGVISDSVNQVGSGIGGSVATGDLPANVQIISDSNFLANATNNPPGQDTDEGRAMLELIHDVAPGAELAFATAIGGQQVFADAIRALRAAGCDIIVDDVGYPAEPYFQPGIIDQAIGDVVAGGAIYVTAAGNDADSGYEVPVTFSGPSAAQLVDWDTGPAADTRLRVETTTGGTLYLQWDNPYNGLVGNVSTDLDIYAFDTTVPSRIRAFGTANNLRTGVPVESMVLGAGRFDIQIRVADAITGKPLPTRIKFVLLGATTTGSLFVEYPGTRSSIFGHSGSSDVISVGAVPFFNAPPFSSGNPILSEDFSSTGPVTQVFDANGNRLATPETLQKPDISGIDNINTSFFTGLSEAEFIALQQSGTFDQADYDSLFDSDILPNFGGTSAAAPNAAATIALILQTSPNSTAEEIRDVLKSTATALNGSSAGDFDPKGGFGLINTFAAVEPFVSAPTVQAIILADPALGGLDTITIVFSQQVSGFDISDLRLSFEDEGINLLTGNNGPRKVDGGRTYVLEKLRALTSATGTYTLQLNDFDGNIRSPIGLPLQGGASRSFEVRPVPGIPVAPSGVALKPISQDTVRVRWIDNSGLSESGFQIERSEEPTFTRAVKHFTVGANVTVFTDTDSTIAGKRLYYRVRAFNIFGQFSTFSLPQSTATPSTGEVILDNESTGGVTINGTWDLSSDVAGFLGSSYLDDLNSGKGTNSVRFTPTLSTTGDYFVYARWTRAADRATNVPVDITFSGGHKTVTVDQRNSGGGGWVLLGKFKFTAGQLGSVVFNTGGTNGKVIVDAVRFLSATGA